MRGRVRNRFHRTEIRYFSVNESDSEMDKANELITPTNIPSNEGDTFGASPLNTDLYEVNPEN